MKRFVASVILALCMVFSLALVPAVTASAAVCSTASNPLACACGASSNAKGSAACSAKTTDPISGPNGAIMKASLIISTIAGIAAVIIMIVGGFQYITSSGDSNKTAGARNAIVGAAIGLVIVAAAESIVVFVVSKL